MQNGENQPSRRYISALSSFNINNLNLKNPLLSICWSFSFPGFGYFYNSNNILGMILMVWEVIINNSAKINLTIFYSLLGDFETAKKVANLRTFIAYVGIYVFCMWDSYRRSNEVNKQYLLAYENDENITSFKLTTLEVNYLEKRDPLLASLWTVITPGAYLIYLQKLPQALFTFVWMGAILYNSNVFTSIMYTFWGQFESAKNILDIQWFLYLPSIYGFTIYKAYETTVENNRVFKYEQSTFLKKEYQHEDFIMPV